MELFGISIWTISLVFAIALIVYLVWDKVLRYVIAPVIVFMVFIFSTVFILLKNLIRYIAFRIKGWLVTRKFT